MEGNFVDTNRSLGELGHCVEGATVDVSSADNLVKLSRRREKNNTRGIECVWYLHYLQSDETGSLQSWHTRLTLHSPTKKRRYFNPAVAESYQGSTVHVVQFSFRKKTH